MYKGGIQALELLKADKKTIKALEKTLKEEHRQVIKIRDS